MSTPTAAELMTPDGYWNSRQTEIRKLRTMSDYGQRMDYGKQLAEAGYVIDRAIDLDQAMDPYTCMLVRQNNGFTWVPNAGQPNLPTMPNCPVPGLPPYNEERPWPNSIKVSILAADYPPQPDVPPAPVPQTKLGPPFPMPDGSMAWLPGPGLNQSTSSEGDTFTEGGVKYVVHYDMGNQAPMPQIWETVFEG
jgi:hypothetical protein